MSTHLKEREQKILHILERLAQQSAKETPILVEGRRDAETLRKLAITGKIITTKTSGKSFLDVVSEVKNCGAQEVVLLMDFDRRGKEWTKKLKQHLEKMRIKPNTSFWRNLLNLTGHEVKDIEGLASYMKTLERKTGSLNETSRMQKESAT
ncbi:toprim domain-containing protein [Candidatus Bathyarchaeota archaeon]|nr:toprim domain-containing protein [Candidatus Bathyarchaeota archaeon]